MFTVEKRGPHIFMVYTQVFTRKNLKRFRFLCLHIFLQHRNIYMHIFPNQSHSLANSLLKKTCYNAAKKLYWWIEVTLFQCNYFTWRKIMLFSKFKNAMCQIFFQVELKVAKRLHHKNFYWKTCASQYWKIPEKAIPHMVDESEMCYHSNFILWNWHYLQVCFER